MKFKFIRKAKVISWDGIFGAFATGAGVFSFTTQLIAVAGATFLYFLGWGAAALFTTVTGPIGVVVLMATLALTFFIIKKSLQSNWREKLAHRKQENSRQDKLFRSRILARIQRERVRKDHLRVVKHDVKCAMRAAEKKGDTTSVEQYRNQCSAIYKAVNDLVTARYKLDARVPLHDMPLDRSGTRKNDNTAEDSDTNRRFYQGKYDKLVEGINSNVIKEYYENNRAHGYFCNTNKRENIDEIKQALFLLNNCDEAQIHPKTKFAILVGCLLKVADNAQASQIRRNQWRFFHSSSGLVHAICKVLQFESGGDTHIALREIGPDNVLGLNGEYLRTAKDPDDVSEKENDVDVKEQFTALYNQFITLQLVEPDLITNVTAKYHHLVSQPS